MTGVDPFGGPMWRVAAGCSLACGFCTDNGGNDGVPLASVAAGDAGIPREDELLVYAGDLVSPEGVRLVARARDAGVRRVTLYAHAGSPPGLLPPLVAAGLGGLYLVLPAADRAGLAERTGGRGSLARVAGLLREASALGVPVILELPLVHSGFGTAPDVLERALRLCGTVRAVALRFARLRVDGRVVDWEFGDAAGAVAEVGRICEREGLAFRMRPEDALRGCPETDLPPIVLRRAGLAALRDAVRERRLPCHKPWTSLEILGSSRVLTPCCNEFLRPLREAPAEPPDSWNGPFLRQARRALASGDLDAVCRTDCPNRLAGDRSDGWLTLEPVADAFRDNLATCMKEASEGAEVLACRPLFVGASTSAACNLRCRMCSTLAPRGGDGGGIPDPRQAVDAVLDLLPTLRILSLTGGGEPLLGAATAGILDRMAAFPDAAVCLTTNGVLLDEAWLGRLVRARVLGVNVSVNAATRGTYQAICGVDAFERLIGNVRRLVEVAASLRPRPLVRLSMVVQDENLSELPEFLRMTAGLGTAVSLHPVAGEDGAPAGLFADPQGLRAVESLLRTKVLPLLPALPASHRQEVQALLAIVRDRRRAANPP